MKRAFLAWVLGFAFLAAWRVSGSNLEIPASAGTIVAPFILTNDCLVQPVQTDATNGGRASFEFITEVPGEYAIRASVDAPAGNAHSFCINIDGEPTAPSMVWEIPVTAGFATNWVSTRESGAGKPKIFRLGPGRHQLIIRGTHANTSLARLWILKRPDPPTGLRISTGR